MGASFRGHASGAPSKKSRVSSGSGWAVPPLPPPPGMGGASRSQGVDSARLRGRGRVGALSQPGEGPRPGARGGAVPARGAGARYLGRGRSPTCGRRRSCPWWSTTACRRRGLRWCSARAFCPGR